MTTIITSVINYGAINFILITFSVAMFFFSDTTEHLLILFSWLRPIFNLFGLVSICLFGLISISFVRFDLISILFVWIG